MDFLEGHRRHAPLGRGDGFGGDLELKAREDERKELRSAVEDLTVRRSVDSEETIKVCPFSKSDLELASGFGKIASRAIATAIGQGGKRVIQRRFDVGVLEAVPEKKASMPWVRPER